MNRVPTHPAPAPGILDIAAYVPGGSTVPAGVEPHKLSSNESPVGASPAARAALENVGDALQIYPDGSARALREAIGEVHGLNPDNIVCGNGSDDLLSLTATTYLKSGDEAVHTEHGFLYYPIVIRAAGATPVVAREVELTAHVDNILAAVTGRTRIVFLANPNNPTGTWLPISEVRRLQAGLPRDVLLVLDAAYAEYVRKNDYEAGIELVSSCPNVVMTRTFSKIHGLAALRIGWLYAPTHVVDALNRVRGPFNVNAAAQLAAAAAVRDRDHVARSVLHNEEWIGKVTDALRNIGLEIPASAGNFVLIRFGDETMCSAADAMLTERGYVLRRVAAYGLADCLRMTIGTQQVNEAVIAALEEFMGWS